MFYDRCGSIGLHNFPQFFLQRILQNCPNQCVGSIYWLFPFWSSYAINHGFIQLWELMENLHSVFGLLLLRRDNPPIQCPHDIQERNLRPRLVCNSPPQTTYINESLYQYYLSQWNLWRACWWYNILR